MYKHCFGGAFSFSLNVHQRLYVNKRSMCYTVCIKVNIVNLRNAAIRIFRVAIIFWSTFFGVNRNSCTIDTACCTSLSMPQLKVMTSMAIRDDVVSGESYYVREVRYLKRMLDEIGQGTMTLYVIDEILKGTNQKERLAASEAVLKYLTHFPGFCMIATHDIELVNKLQEMYAPYYFESHITENNVTFDYCIHPGRGGESNALALLRAFGFPDEIIQDANQTISSL